jgi:pyruvate,water dikinase
MSEDMSEAYIKWFQDLRSSDVAMVGGKNSSLGEMTSQLGKHGIPVPPGYATTSKAYWDTIDASGLKFYIKSELKDLSEKRKSLSEVGRNLRTAVSSAPLSPELEEAIIKHYHKLAAKCGEEDVSVAVRSSATAEDLPEASFAGQQETYLNIRGERQLIQACKDCYASLFTDRAIIYRDNNGFDHTKVALSIGIQQMVRSDRGSAGVVFTIDTETGFPDVVLVNSTWGLGENVVQGTVSPDEYLVYKPALDIEGTKPIIRKHLGKKEKTMIFGRGAGKTTRNIETTASRKRRFSLKDEDVLLLAKWAKTIEKHYSARNKKDTPMDIEWAKDGKTGELFIVQARPETVQARSNALEIVSYALSEPIPSETLVEGTSVGQKIVHGEVCLIHDVHDLASFRPGCILVSEMTDPDWVPIMRQAAGIVTDHGGRTCHAAIVSRELGIPAIVGTGDGTERLIDGQKVTLTCDGSDVGRVYGGTLEYFRNITDLKEIPETKTKVMLNLADPDSALRWWRLPIDGIGLARMEFTITEHVKAHPMALAHPERITDPEVKAKINELTRHHASPSDYFVETLGRGLGTLAAMASPKPVIVRMSDFKTNEYATLLGGADFEPKEENPMLGFRGASRYYNDCYRDGFSLECKAIKYIRETLGLRNVTVMIPFCRTLGEADKVLEVMAEEGLERSDDFQVYVMCEVPSNVILAKEFAKRFDGFSIGSNDLTQLTLGIDRDSDQLADLFDERDEAVVTLIRNVITDAKSCGKKVGICGQAPSDLAGFAEMLVDAGIDSISLNPDSVLKVRQRIAMHEKAVAKEEKKSKKETGGDTKMKGHAKKVEKHFGLPGFGKKKVDAKSQ